MFDLKIIFFSLIIVSFLFVSTVSAVDVVDKQTVGAADSVDVSGDDVLMLNNDSGSVLLESANDDLLSEDIVD